MKLIAILAFAVVAVSLSVAHSQCATNETFYDQLFAADVFQVTYVRGYYDAHGESFGSVFAEQVFKTKKIEVYAKDDVDDVQRLEDRLLENGFSKYSVSANEAVLTKTFSYKRNQKTARVRIVRSTALCSGEIPNRQGSVWRFDHEMCEEQGIATRAAQAAWSEALAKNEVAIYDGHARGGDGPDFGPLGSRQGLSSLRSIWLSEVRTVASPLVLQINGCDSIRYFSNVVGRWNGEWARKNSVLFFGTVGDSTWENGPSAAAALVQGLLQNQCLDQIAKHINATKWQPVPPSEFRVVTKSQWPSRPIIPAYSIARTKKGDYLCFKLDGRGEAIGPPVESFNCH